MDLNPQPRWPLSWELERVEDSVGFGQEAWESFGWKDCGGDPDDHRLVPNVQDDDPEHLALTEASAVPVEPRDVLRTGERNERVRAPDNRAVELGPAESIEGYRRR